MWVIVLCMGTFAWAAPNSAEVVEPQPGPFENLDIPHNGARGNADATTQPVAQTSSDHFGMGRLVLALGLVLALIFLFQRVGKKYLGHHTGATGHRAMQVVARTTVAPKQQLLLVQVGQRLLVVANSGANMSRLCEIKNGDEVASLLAQVRSETRDGVGKAFGSLFGRSTEKFEEAPSISVSRDAKRSANLAEADDAADVESHDRDIATDEKTDPDLATATESRAELEHADAKVTQTRRELDGLMDKVRQLSRQFQRS